MQNLKRDMIHLRNVDGLRITGARRTRLQPHVCAAKLGIPIFFLLMTYRGMHFWENYLHDIWTFGIARE